MLRALLVVTLVSLVTCEQCGASSASSCEGEATDSSFIQGKRKTPSPQRKPHVLLILADDYGWANFGKHRLSSATAEDRQAQAEAGPTKLSKRQRSISLNLPGSWRVMEKVSSGHSFFLKKWKPEQVG